MRNWVIPRTTTSSNEGILPSNMFAKRGWKEKKKADTHTANKGKTGANRADICVHTPRPSVTIAGQVVLYFAQRGLDTRERVILDSMA
mmetsp:Transcript_43304/g.113948  ORF Transcript_43304/g.113948 Transcript_43304/m.113948 type:complete len:88 (-) Transcript_43304:2-265(-)